MSDSDHRDLTPNLPNFEVRLERILTDLEGLQGDRKLSDDEVAKLLAGELALQGFSPSEQDVPNYTRRFYNYSVPSLILMGGALCAWIGDLYIEVSTSHYSLLGNGWGAQLLYWLYNALYWIGGAKVVLISIIPSAIGAWLWQRVNSRQESFPFWTRSSPNVLAQFGQGEQHLVLLAHYVPYRPDIPRFVWQLSAALACLTPALSLASLFFEPVLHPLLLMCVLYFFLFFLLTAWEMVQDRKHENLTLRGRASGVAAALEVADRLRGKLHARVSLVLSASQSGGVEAFLASLDPQNAPNTLVITLGSVGGTSLHYSTPRPQAHTPLGLGQPAPSDTALEIAHKLSLERPELRAQPLARPLADPDAWLLARAGVACLNVVSQPGASESLDTLDHATVLRAATFAEALGYGWVHRDAH